MKLGDVFTDAAVARAYRYRAPYPPDTFAILEELIVGPRVILDVGAGNGALAREMVRFAARVDAVDPSEALIAEGRRLPGGTDDKLRWMVGTAEDAALDGPYGLITAGASIHWLDPARAMPRFSAHLAPGARLVLVDIEDGPHPLPGMIDIVTRYSEVTHHEELPEIVQHLEASGRFVREGERLTALALSSRTLDEYVEFLHSTSTLARVRLGDRAAGFDADVRALFARHGLTGIEREYRARVIWGRPVAA